jgi:DNA-3-methyladenine glycosylase II
MKLHRRRTPFVALVTAVTYQQLNGTAAKTILKRMLALFPGKRFPTPEDILAMPDDRLRTAGLSRAKAAAIKDIAAKTVAGIVPGSRVITRLTNEEIIERLTSVRGVGPWTVEMLLMFTLGRLDVLPATDYGVRKGFAVAFGWKELPTPKELMEYGERWRPHRTTAAWYLWRALELPAR